MTSEASSRLPDAPPEATEIQSDLTPFDEACRRFFESLPERERTLYSPCASPKDLLDGLRKLETLANRRSRRGSRIFGCVQRLNNRLKPYFDTINIFVQASPQYFALVLGIVRLILQV